MSLQEAVGEISLTGHLMTHTHSHTHSSSPVEGLFSPSLPVQPFHLNELKFNSVQINLVMLNTFHCTSVQLDVLISKQ